MNQIPPPPVDVPPLGPPPAAPGATPSTAGGASAAGGGASVAPLTEERRWQSSADQRRFYVLDTLGDAQQDGHVYMYRLEGDQIVLGGQVGLRPANPSLPSLDLRHVALSPGGGRLIVSQQGEPSQWIFLDAASLSIERRVPAPAGQFARQAVFSADGAQAFLVAGLNRSTSPPSALHIADTASQAIVGEIALPANTALSSLAATPDGALLIGAGGPFLHSIDLRSGTYGGRVLHAFPESDPGGPRSGSFTSLDLDPSGVRIYAGPIRYTREDRLAVGVFDTRTLGLIDQIDYAARSQTGALLMRLAPAGGVLLVSATLGTFVQVFDTFTREELARIPVDAAFRLSTLAVA